MSTALLQTTYFGPVQWYQKLHRYEHTLIEQYDSYQKQTFRNRCIIATANGLQALTVPVDTHPVLSASAVHPVLGSSAASTVLDASAAESTKCLLKDVRISDHNQWRRVHWNALQSAYSESPFFEYYADDIRPFFEQKYDFLVDFNEAIRQKMCELIDIHPSVEYTQEFLSPHASALNPQPSAFSLQPSALQDFRDVISAKHPQPDADFEVKRYWQVFQRKHGFLTNLSILDLLFCMGPESVFYL